MAFGNLPVDDDEGARDASASPGGQEEVRWRVVAETPGLMPATVLAGRLRVEGIPVRAWQESAGRAIGLTVGLLGAGYVAVPEEFVDEATAVLDDVDIPGENIDSDLS